LKSVTEVSQQLCGLQQDGIEPSQAPNEGMPVS